MTEKPTHGTEAWARDIQSPHRSHFSNRPHDPERCCASVHDSGRSVTFHQCCRRPVIHYGALGYCRQHDPAKVVADREARDRAMRERWAKQDAQIMHNNAMVKFRNKALAAIRQIAAGHNDPRALAQSVLALEPEES